ncbi:MAG: hypothetical protein U5N53_24560 [Mycobacterium sp.]|nr:hypothetical protein [Mycobacterium sp.]
MALVLQRSRRGTVSRADQDRLSAGRELQGVREEIAQMAQRLQDSGWTSAPDFKSHGTVLKKNNVVAVLGPQNASNPNRDIQVYGECRDTTTDKGDNQPEPLTLG